MTHSKKTDVLNLRLDAALAGEIDRIAAWRGKTASEVARDLLQYGIRVERDLEARELRRPYSSGRIDRNAEDVRIEVRADFKFLNRRELAELEEAVELGEAGDVSGDAG